MRRRIVAQFLNKHGVDSVYDALTMVYPEQIKALEGPHFFQFPLDIQALILSHCWRITPIIALVCKAWANIVATRLDYWKQGIREQLKIPATLTSPWTRDYFMNRWHPFDIEVLPTRRDQLSWLFNSYKCIWVVKGKLHHFRICMHIDQNTRRYVRWHDINEQCIVMVCIHYTKTIDNKTDVDPNLFQIRKQVYPLSFSPFKALPYIRFKKADNPYIEHMWTVKKSKEIGSYVEWTGQGIAKSGEHIAHGDGCWTNTATGEVILQGKGVAFDGEMHDGKTWIGGVKRMKLQND